MFINQLMITPSQLPYGLIMLIKKRNMTVSMPIPRIMITLEAEQNVFTFPSSDLEVRAPDTVDAVAGPDQVAVVPDDVWACLAGLVLLGWRVRETGEGCNEEVAGGHLLCRRDCDVQAWR